MAIEWLWLVRAAHWPPAGAAARLLPGALLVLALRAALVGAAPEWVALALAGSLPAHLADLVMGAPPRR